MWPSFSANPMSVGKAMVLGSGLFPKDTLFADYVWSTPEMALPWSVSQSDRAWELQFNEDLPGATWVLRSLDGRDAARGRLRGANVTLAYPEASGLYLVEVSDAAGRRWSQKLLRP